MTAKTMIKEILSHGCDSLSDAQLLSLFLNKKADDSALSQATRMLDSVGLAGLYGQSSFGGGKIDGMSDRQCALLQAGRVLAKRASLEALKQVDALTSPEHVRQYLQLHVSGRHEEVFGVLFLDNRHRVIAYKDMFYGTIDSAAVYPRCVVKLALTLNAAACIFVHNHPSGIAEPSDTDVRLTRRLNDALALVDVRSLDHLIIGQGVYTSLAERGLM